MVHRKSLRSLFAMLAVLAILATSCAAPATTAAPTQAAKPAAAVTAAPAAAQPTAAPKAPDTAATAAPAAKATAAPAAAATAAPAAAGGKVTTVTFWHAMSGSREKTVKDLAEKFNKLHPDMQVVPTLQGSYEETLTKALAAYKAGQPPTIVGVYEVGTRTMLDSGAIIPVNTLDKGDVKWDEVVQPIAHFCIV